MTPFGVTVLSVTLNAAGIAPSANNFFPAPNVTGNTFSHRASTKSCFRSVNQIPAAPHVQVWPVLLLDFGDFFRNIAAQKHGRLPFGRSDGIRGHVLCRSLDLLPNVGMLRPECCEHFKCLPPEQDV